MTTARYAHATPSHERVLRVDHALLVVLLVVSVAALLALMLVALQPVLDIGSEHSGQVVAPGQVRTPNPRPAGY